MTVKVLIADGDKAFRDTAKCLLEGLAVVVGEAGTGEEAVRLARDLHPTIVLMDIGMVDIARRIKSDVPESKVILLTAHDEDAYLSATGKGGADGFLPKRLTRAELLPAVRAVAAGRPWAIWPSQERRWMRAAEDSGWDGGERRRPRPSRVG